MLAIGIVRVIVTPLVTGGRDTHTPHALVFQQHLKKAYSEDKEEKRKKLMTMRTATRTTTTTSRAEMTNKKVTTP